MGEQKVFPEAEQILENMDDKGVDILKYDTDSGDLIVVLGDLEADKKDIHTSMLETGEAYGYIIDEFEGNNVIRIQKEPENTSPYIMFYIDGMGFPEDGVDQLFNFVESVEDADIGLDDKSLEARLNVAVSMKLTAEMNDFDIDFDVLGMYTRISPDELKNFYRGVVKDIQG